MFEDVLLRSGAGVVTSTLVSSLLASPGRPGSPHGLPQWSSCKLPGLPRSGLRQSSCKLWSRLDCRGPLFYSSSWTVASSVANATLFF